MTIQTINSCTLEVTGLSELVAANVGEMGDAVRAELKPVHTQLDLDLSAVRLMDSSGLGALVSLQKRLRGQNGIVRLLRPAPHLRQVLELTRLHRLFEIVD